MYLANNYIDVEYSIFSSTAQHYNYRISVFIINILTLLDSR